MKKLSIKELIEFRNKTDKAKRGFVTNLKLDKEKTKTEGGGDYWVSSLSTLSNCYKNNNLQLILDKKNELTDKYETTEHARTKTMYKRNLNILNNYEDFNFNKWKPSSKIKFIKKNKDDSILNIKGFELKVTPNHVFSFQENDIEEIGAIWFIAQLNGFKNVELGMFTDILHSYLKKHFSKNYNINSKYCVAVDVFNNIDVNYLQLEKNKIQSILSPTLEEIKKLM